MPKVRVGLPQAGTTQTRPPPRPPPHRPNASRTALGRSAGVRPGRGPPSSRPPGHLGGGGPATSLPGPAPHPTLAFAPRRGRARPAPNHAETPATPPGSASPPDLALDPAPSALGAQPLGAQAGKGRERRETLVISRLQQFTGASGIPTVNPPGDRRNVLASFLKFNFTWRSSLNIFDRG
ncbi:basic proline-rich protein-like [Pteropus medius]|uniref:basic proline-rich protein-like n=1 Tax=Pteropus vampyrus TaxID=132908 RepID=UPI00196A99EB|nr:basic proline-rich protein-like [Pteropus giganteus]